MRIKNQQNLSIETLREKLEQKLPEYKYEIHKNAITVCEDEKTKMNIVEMEEEFWVVEAVPFHFKLVVVVVLISIFAYWMQLQDFHWMVNVGSCVMAFFVLGYVANWVYGWMYAKHFQDLKPKLIEALKNLLREP